ncbi:MAG TPA: alpha/beta hydrolase [Terracidiphilus sp.]|nr:alpha/beta hydrolase [Terracidiphilus sp.]
MELSSQAGVRCSTLDVPGAKLYYEVQGAGPLLLMIPGGPADAGIFAAISAHLADRFTVVRYDPRGNSRSVLDDPAEEQEMDRHGDDAARLLAVFGDEPAFVLGSSGGAQIGLNLAARHPEQVRVLVAHEPPCMQLLPNAEENRAFTDEIYATYRQSGASAAMQKFLEGTGLGAGRKPDNASPPPPELRESFARMQGNLDYFFAHGFRPISRYIPAVPTLKSGKPRVAIAVGETSSGQIAHRSALVLAEQLGTAAAVFPGGHGGYNDLPVEFAGKLMAVLGGEC